MTKIISVRSNSVRVRTGLVTFDVLIHAEEGGKIEITLPQDLYLFSNNFERLRRLVVEAYIESNKENEIN